MSNTLSQKPPYKSHYGGILLAHVHVVKRVQTVRITVFNYINVLLTVGIFYSELSQLKLW